MDDTRFKTQGLLGVFIDDSTEMITVSKEEFMKLCFAIDHLTGSESAFMFYHKLANDTEVRVAKIVYDELSKYRIIANKSLEGNRT
jgi:hypothetical protein